MRKFKAILALLLCFSLMMPMAAWADDADLTKITFNGKSITFDPASTDLFVKYKNVLPGDTITQPMRLVNDSSKKTSFYLKMKIAEQAEGLSAAELAKVHELLFDQNLLSLKIVADGVTLYDDKAGGKRIDSFDNVGAYTTDETDTSERGIAIPLGTLNKHKQADFEVILTVNPEMGNEYANLAAYVDWEFQINAKSSSGPPVIEPDPDPEPKPDPKPQPDPTPAPEPTPGPTIEPTPSAPTQPLPPPVFPNETPVPKTGDDFPLLICGAIVLLSAVMIVVLTKLYRKNKA